MNAESYLLLLQYYNCIIQTYLNPKNNLNFEVRPFGKQRFHIHTNTKKDLNEFLFNIIVNLQ